MPQNIPAIQRVRSSEQFFSSPDIALSHQRSAIMFKQIVPISRRSASYPDREKGFIWRKRGEDGGKYLRWPERNEEIFKKASPALLDLAFDAESYSHDDLMHLALEIYLQQRLDERLGVPRIKLKRFIVCIRHHMLENPYHNFTHVVDVLQSVYALGTRSGLLSRLTDLETFALFTGALCHDLEHPGVSNIVVIKANPSLSKVYGESSLEKHHSLRALSLMMHEEVELLSSLDVAAYIQIREMITKVILATDMSRHSDFMARLDQLVAADESDAQRDRQLEMEILIKVADTSNVIRPMAVAKKWAVRITDEFFAQGDMEASLGLAVSGQCDRQTRTRVGLQKGFIDGVISPFYDRLVKAYPALEQPLAQVYHNRQAWDLYDDPQLLADVGRSR
jgi:hypothetical protein